MDNLKNISVVIIVKNGAATIKKTLESISAFSDVVIYDNGSTDGTLEIIKEFSDVNLVQGEFLGFGATKNKAVSYAKNDWIFSLDVDEVISAELLEELRNLPLKNTLAVYKIGRLNFYNNKVMKCCGWYPDVVLRIFNRNTTKFNDNLVHESIISDKLEIQLLKTEMHHFPYRNASGLVDKMQKYATLYAKQHKGKKKVTPIMVVLKSIVAFFKFYILKKGIFYGYEGLLISVSNAVGVFYKYIKLYEENKGISQ